jgi:hypothetical protein
MYAPLPDWLYHVLFPVLRWLHMVSCALVVGGMLFYEFVVPHAIEDLKKETQLEVFGKVRWFFRTVILWSAVFLLVSGSAATWRLSPKYIEVSDHEWMIHPPFWWGAAHILFGVLTLCFALQLTFGRRVPPMSLMRLNFVILLIVVFLASVSRHIRLYERERKEFDEKIRQQWIDSPTPMPQPATTETSP